MQRELFVLFTMDVEPAAAAAGHSGPVSDEAGMRAVLDYRDVLRSWGYRATYFVHPELTQSQPEFFTGLAKDGSALGLHIHTTKFAPSPQPCELGGLVADEQRRLLRMGTEMFEKGLGYRPTLFRPGCFSASDVTYQILCELGFSGGSVSIPGRIWPERSCVWSGAYPYAHLAHRAFRQSVGDLPFVDIPLSVDLTGGLKHHPVGFCHYPDLRPGGVYSEAAEVDYDRCSMLRSILQRTVADDPPVKTLVVDVHNDRDFTATDSQAAGHFTQLLEAIVPTCRTLGLKPIPSTYTEVVQRFRKERE
ncbi:MAG: polysaccharide deacetylase family protein [Lentisphaerae bacterium]|nr:polysaccharide deacetylase family protein [Lentisphaerota bacterium]MBT5612379.1 polysaccharide deacetylase family protein [Lentisphaerota bacterium]MBT7056683.1 polysaccharide deacetylase family protein [Lentisphaerota bacterium]MBT7840608.1 polysaccharide deacetylase family protein [Lentisphaerota bacterium]